MSAFTRQLAFRLQDRGHQSAKHHLSQLSPYALEYLERALNELAGSGQPFTSDTLWQSLSDTMRVTVERAANAVGACFSAAAKRGQIRRTGKMVPSTRVGARGRQIAEWTGGSGTRLHTYLQRPDKRTV